MLLLQVNGHNFTPKNDAQGKVLTKEWACSRCGIPMPSGNPQVCPKSRLAVQQEASPPANQSTSSGGTPTW